MTTSFRIDYGVPANDRLPREGKPWTEEEDRFLLDHGRWLGYAFVAAHHLGRPRWASYRRLAWLRANRPELCAKYPKPRTGDK